VHQNLLAVGSAKINVDWPQDAAGEPPAYGRFGVSDHDPAVAVVDASASYPKVRALIDHLVATGQLRSGVAVGVGALLDAAEALADRGLTRAAGVLLSIATATLRTLSLVGLVPADVATGLSAEIDQLRR
jgi:hypothetical protein